MWSKHPTAWKPCKAFATTLPQLVLVDIQMPLLDGFGVLRELRADQRFSAIPIVALTAFAMQGDKDRALDGRVRCGYIPQARGDRRPARTNP